MERPQERREAAVTSWSLPITYSFAPLQSVIDRRLRDDGLEPSVKASAEMLGFARRTVVRWADHGLSLTRVEECCAVLDVFPYDLYPELLTDAITSIERECEAVDCTTRFVPVFRGAKRRFCGDACKHRVWMRGHREKPEERERSRAYQRQYNADVREAAQRRKKAA